MEDKEKMMKRSVGGILLASAVTLSGCASIVSDSAYPVTINSSPEGVKYTVTNAKKGYDVMSGVTPATISLSADNGFFSKASYMVTFEKDGYEPVSIPLKAGMDGWYVGNLLFGGLIGLLIIDPATGAMWKLDERVQVSLAASEKDDVIKPEPVAEKKSSEPVEEDPEASDQVTLMMIDQVPQSYRDNLVRLN